MGTNNGRWEGDTLVVDVTGLNGLAWFDRAGDFASDKLHVVERFTRTDRDHLQYEATIEDASVFSRPWKISMPLYRRVENNARLRGICRRADLRAVQEKVRHGLASRVANGVTLWQGRPFLRHGPR